MKPQQKLVLWWVLDPPPGFYPSIFFRLSGAESRGQQAKQGIQDVPLSYQCSPALPGGPRGVPRPDEIYSLSSVFWIYSRASYQFDVPGKPPKGGVQEAILIRCPNCLSLPLSTRRRSDPLVLRGELQHSGAQPQAREYPHTRRHLSPWATP